MRCCLLINKKKHIISSIVSDYFQKITKRTSLVKVSCAHASLIKQKDFSIYSFFSKGKSSTHMCSWLWRHALYVLKEQLYSALGWKPRNYAKHMYLRIVIVDNSLHNSYTETKTKFPLSEKYVCKNIYF